MMFPASEPVISAFFYLGGLIVGLLIGVLMEIGLDFSDPTKERPMFILKTCLLYLILVFSGLLSAAFVKQKLRRSIFEKNIEGRISNM